MTPNAPIIAAELLGLLAMPIAILKQCGQSLAANSAFAQLLKDQDRTLNDVLSKSSLEKLRAAPDQSLLIALPARTPRPSMLVQIRLLPPSLRRAWPESYAVFVGEVLSRGVPPQPHLLLDLFGFTPAEARVAHALASGASATDISSTLRVSHETVRSHVKSILRKLGVARQTDLVAILSSASPLRCNYDTRPE